METGLYTRTVDDAAERIQAQEPFNLREGKTLYGREGGADQDPGLLPEQYRADAAAARYVVYSYRTPVGWVRQDGTKVVPDVGYSPTTGQHQYLVAHAWGIGFRPARGREYVPVPATDTLYGQPRRLRSGGIDTAY